MLCHEGISLMLNIFQGKAVVPNFRVVAPLEGEIQEIRVDPEVRLNLGRASSGSKSGFRF